MVKAIVCGGRDYRNRDRLFQIMDAAVDRLGVDAIAQGGQRSGEEGGYYGADWLAKEWAHERGLQYETFYAAWDLHGKAAGPMRNAEMLARSGATLCIAFPGGAGTADMVRRAEAEGIEVKRIDWAE